MTELEALRQFADEARNAKQPDPVVSAALKNLDAALNNIGPAAEDIPTEPESAPPETIECPVCHNTEVPLVRLRTLVICGVCGASLVADGAEIRSATHADLEDLSKIEMAELRRVRASLARPERKQR